MVPIQMRGAWLAIQNRVERAKHEEEGWNLWDLIWIANVPGVVKNFALRGCKNIITCNMKLKKRMDIDSHCDFYGDEREQLIQII